MFWSNSILSNFMRPFLFCIFSIACMVAWGQPKMIQVPYGKKRIAVSVYETTVGDYENFIKATGYITDAEIAGQATVQGGEYKKGINWRHNSKGKMIKHSEYPKYPVIHLSSRDVQMYCRWAKVRLPSEEEWIFLFREGKGSSWQYCGSNNLKEVAWNDSYGSINKEQKVGMKRPNGLGLYDMSGNVWELCSTSTGWYVLKGGSWLDSPSRLGYKDRWLIEDKYVPESWLWGFRTVKDM